LTSPCSPRTTEILKRTTYLSTLFWLPPSPASTPNLKFIQFFSAGINHVANSPYYTDSKIPLLSANGVHGPQIAEWVVMMELVHHHNYVKLYEQQKEKKWLQMTGMATVDRVGKRVGILGYGSIGRQGE
jgi:phosphoglycerate dehydrogenase-like enzyme